VREHPGAMVDQHRGGSGRHVAVYCRRRPPYVLRIRETFKGYEAGTVPAGEFLVFIVQLCGEIQAPCAARPST
jgi:hypothetical protein